MPHKSLTVLAVVSSLGAGASWEQAAAQQPAQSAPSVVQPGAPGQGTKPFSGTVAEREPTAADIQFMQGMIMHHGQAVEMTHMLLSRSHNPEVLELGRKIDVSQTDEMGWMKRWLQDHGQPIMAPMDMSGMKDMDMSKMDVSGMMPAMPGMLTKAQMEALRNAKEPEFDHLFLTGMIQHHSGALTMVKDLFLTPGAAQDPLLFDFTSDVTNTQQAEMDTMRNMLAKEKHQ